LGAAWGKEAIDIGQGGSIPFLFDFARTFPGAALLVTGVEDPESNAHSENESLHLAEFENVCVAEATVLGLLGATGRSSCFAASSRCVVRDAGAASSSAGSSRCRSAASSAASTTSASTATSSAR